MPENSDEREKRLLRELEGKNISHYSTLLGAWIQNRMERDKTLISLSTAGIGLLFTILTTMGVRNWLEILFYSFAVISFLITIITSLHIYQINSKILEDDLRGSSSDHPLFKKLDQISFFAFCGGVFFAALLGVTSGISQINKNERSDKMTFKKIERQSASPETLEKSLSGISDLRPVPPSDPLTNQSTDLPPNPIDSSSNVLSPVGEAPIKPPSD